MEMQQLTTAENLQLVISWQQGEGIFQIVLSLASSA